MKKKKKFDNKKIIKKIKQNKKIKKKKKKVKIINLKEKFEALKSTLKKYLKNDKFIFFYKLTF